MALFVRIKKQSLQVKEDGNTADVIEEVDYTTERFPFPVDAWYNIYQSAWSNQVLMLQASGHDLEFIMQQISGIPYARGHTVWKGDMANFIVMNLNIL